MAIKPFTMILTYFLTFFCSLALNLNRLAQNKVKEEGRSTLFTSNGFVKYGFSVIGLAPLYFLYQENNLLWMMIGKYIAIGVLSLIAGNASFNNAQISKISLASVASAGIGVILMIVWLVVS